MANDSITNLVQSQMASEPLQFKIDAYQDKIQMNKQQTSHESLMDQINAMAQQQTLAVSIENQTFNLQRIPFDMISTTIMIYLC